ncbi:MAG: hypothetical protein EPN21_19590 [Methylococcaceae bacterium]|nr:MAG: hypothetical protein EPN21_19590 [Methylococcaceae bacterium]
MAKTDIDLVGETHQKMLFTDLRTLAEKLYKRNPKEWKKGNHASLEDALNALFTEPYPEPESKHGTDCIRLAFEESYQGDRVAAFIAGLSTMIMDSYGNKHSYYILDRLDAQTLYNSARNIEVAAWMLRSKLDAKGQPYLQSSTQGSEVNLSFERLFGRLIANQDTIAQVTADRTHRIIKTTLQTVMMAFIPL